MIFLLSQLKIVQWEPKDNKSFYIFIQGTSALQDNSQ